MEQNKLDLILKLKPIQTSTGICDSVISNDSGDTWLRNNDKNLLKDLTDGASTVLNSTVEKLSDDDGFTKHTWHVSEIITKESTDTFQLQMPHGLMNLENGDVIVTPIGAFEVTIEKKQIIVNPDPKVESTYVMANAMDDIWNTPAYTPHTPITNSAQMDPFAMSSTMQTQSANPLTFLYGEHQTVTPNQSIQSVIPQASGIGALPYDSIASPGSPMPLMSAQHQFHAALSVHAKSEFQPGYDAGSTLQHTQMQRAGEGNILQDLGITEQTSAIANIHTPEQMSMTSTQNILTDQSPIDMLDEYLGEESLVQNHNIMPCTQISMNPNFTNVTMPSNMQELREPSLIGLIKGFKKRILG